MITTKKEIIEDLREHTRGRSSICIEEFASFIGVHRGTASKMLKGLDYNKVGQQKRFPIRDVAEMLIETRRVH